MRSTAHGTRDRVLHVERCSRRIVPMLRASGYTVRYEEFDGGHEVPAGIASAVASWLA
jgi:phospholipase/carboxylesterase